MTSCECPTESIHYFNCKDDVGRLYNKEQNITSNLKPPIQKRTSILNLWVTDSSHVLSKRINRASCLKALSNYLDSLPMFHALTQHKDEEGSWTMS